MKIIKVFIISFSFLILFSSVSSSQEVDSLRGQKLFWKYSKWMLATVTVGMTSFYFIQKGNDKPADQYLTAATTCGGLTALSFIMDAFMNENTEKAPKKKEVEPETIITKRVIADNKPEIILEYPTPDEKNRITSTKRKIAIRGKILNYSPGSVVNINNKSVYVGEDNTFNYNLQLLEDICLLNINLRVDEGVLHEKNYVVSFKAESIERRGKDYALLFGVDNYDHWQSLLNPVNDISTVENELKINYNFITEKFINFTKNEVYSTLRKYAQIQFNDDDQLFIFFAGHGKFDEVFKEGFLVARDSKRDDENNDSYISHSILKQRIDNIPCRHIFLVIDACFGGALDPVIAQSDSRGENIYSEITKPEFIKRKLKFKTRKYLTSGGKEYVPDGRPGEHSPFARKLLEAFRTYGGSDGILTLSKLNNYIEKVKPEPRFGSFGSDEPGSDFIFIAK